MAVAHDAASSARAAAVTSLSWSHTTSGADRLLVVGVSLWSNVAVSSVTYAGADLTAVGNVVNVNIRVEQWRRIAPATGANTITVNMPSAQDITAGAESATGVDQTTPLGTFASATGTSTGPSVNVSGAVNDLIVDTFSSDSVAGNTATVGAGQTQRWNLGNDTTPLGGGSTEPGAATVTMSWTLSDTLAWATGGVSMKAIVAGAAAPPQRTLMGVGV